MVVIEYSFNSKYNNIYCFGFLILREMTSKIDLYSYCFILGGTIGNGLDRILKGYVIDL